MTVLLDVALSEEQLQLVRSMRAALERGERTSLARQAELGWIGISLPTSAGGGDGTLLDEVVAFREVGRHLGSIDLVAATLAARCGYLAGDLQLARTFSEGSFSVGLGLVAKPEEQCDLVIGAPAPYFLAVSESEVQLVEMAGDPWTILESVDPGTSLCRMASEGRIVAQLRGRDAADLFWIGAVFSAAVLVGIAEAATEMSVDYAGFRKQFRRPIGSFQAVKHRCATMATVSALALAALAAAARAPELSPEHIGAAKILAAEAALANARMNIHNHGAIGFSAEHSAHRYLKRAHVVDQLFGNRLWHQGHLVTAGSMQLDAGNQGGASGGT